MLATSTATALAATWSSQVPAPASTVTSSRPLVSARIVGTARPLWEGQGSWYVKVDGRAVRNPVQLLDKNPDGTYDFTKATIYGTPHWDLAGGNHTAETSCFDGVRYKSSWSFAVGLAPAITGETPAAGSSVDTLTPTITANLSTGGAVSSVVVTVDGNNVPATVTSGILSAKVTTPLEDYATHSATIVATGPTALSATKTWTFDVESKPRMTGTQECTACHTTYPSAHPMYNCVACHGEGSPVGGGYTDPAQYHGPGTNCAQCHFHVENCTDCHGAGYSTVPPLHEFKDDTYHVSSSTSCSPCHSRRLTAEHNRPGLTCATCHASAQPQVIAAIAAGDTACGSCHNATSGHMTEHDGTPNPACTECHNANLVTEHITNQSLTCGVCHDSSDPLVSNAISLGNLNCDACHPGAGSHTALHDVTLGDGCDACHLPNLATEHDARSVDCAGCHESADANVSGAIAAGDKACATCHTTADGHVGLHAVTLAANCGDCHAANLATEHANRSVTCAGCHASTNQDVIDAIAAGDKSC
ncbi:MAG TPA: hypothetical protein VFG89_06155, partial [Coriobacteriia bacterium]|nr:hypothetical protein [Coriobacteriia bacterium]